MEPRRLISPYLASLIFAAESVAFIQMYATHSHFGISTYQLIAMRVLTLAVIYFLFQRRSWAAIAYAALRVPSLYSLFRLSTLAYHVDISLASKLMVLASVATATIALIELVVLPLRQPATQRHSPSTSINK